MYWEYTGTAWTNYLKHTERIEDSAQQYEEVAKQDLAENQIKWLTPSPANNTYAIGVKKTTAEELEVASISDYARLVRNDPTKASMCVASEFARRSDGWPGLQKAYGFKLPDASLATLAESAIYNALSRGDPCTFGEIATTDGRIPAYKLTPLDDDKRFFPIYNPALTVRESVYNDHTDLAKIAEPIARALDYKALHQLSVDADVHLKDETEVAEAWLQAKGFIGRSTPHP
jgi:osmoprotectant transport system substrate-binding protein